MSLHHYDTVGAHRPGQEGRAADAPKPAPSGDASARRVWDRRLYADRLRNLADTRDHARPPDSANTRAADAKERISSCVRIMQRSAALVMQSGLAGMRARARLAASWEILSSKRKVTGATSSENRPPE
jgi:hypothetical protein